MGELIRIREVWKIFGESSHQTIQEGCASKLEQLLLNTANRVAVRDVSLTIKQGEIFVVMGLSGSGKSTLLRMINGLINPTAGSVEIEGQAVQALPPSDLIALRRQKMAMVFQSFALFPQRTALDNAAFGLEVAGMPKGQRQERARQALERVGLGNDLHRRPSQLSGGMQQRVGLARALALDPPILLMDEAFSALDPLIRRDMQDLLLDLQNEQQRTVVFISHDLDEAVRIGDRIALMQDGRLLQCGSAEELLCHPNDPAVRQFFQEVDPSAVISVGAIAEQPAEGLVPDLQDQRKPILHANTLLQEAIPVVAAATEPVPVISEEQDFIGVVTANTLLRSLRTP
ncbi:MAG: glycine/betaine ABC transporter ATP-binding protein [Cyanobium sp. NAT70]|nr:glycine/betaine ABC transporter ATP-binding protein [Cyanobium sp. NAT70]|tara:strand:+ start:3194 stop:4225 length:1032 start_codon:yes stop_codon:yes gene_type:complete